MSKLNCWEHRNCGEAVCPSMQTDKFDGFNSGRNGGRLCWYAKEVTSGRKPKGDQAQKCSECEFFKLVEQEEGAGFTIFV